MSEADSALVLDLIRELDRAPDLATFRAHATTGLRELIGADQGKFEEVDLRTGTNSSISDPPYPDWSERLAEAAQYADQHPAVRMLLSGDEDPSPWRLSDLIPVSSLRRTELHDVLFRPYGVDYQLGTALRVSGPLLIALCLNRGRGDFTERERDMMDLARHHLGRSFEQASLRELVRSLEARQGGAVGAVLLTPLGRIQAITGAASELLEAYFPDAGRDPHLPREIESWLAGRLGDGEGRDRGVPASGPPLVTLREDGGRLLARLLPGSWDGGPATLMLEETRTILSTVALSAHGLSRREIEVLRLVAEGETNQGIAVQLAISPRTVQKHLERVHEKLGVGTRTAAAARALELSREALP